MKMKVKRSIGKHLRTAMMVTLALLGFISLSQAASVTLAWDSDASSQVVGYHLYYGTVSGSYSAILNVNSTTMTTVSGLTDATTYYFVVTGYTVDGLESTPSNEVSFNVEVVSPLVVSLVTAGSTINGPANVSLNASTTGGSAAIVEVQYYAGSTKVGDSVTAPYSAVWTNAQPGNYNLTAIAYDSNGNATSSPAVSLNIVQFGITALRCAQDGSYQLTATAADGFSYDVLASEDLSNWRILQTVSGSGGTVSFTDATATQVPCRFYKLAVHSSATASSKMSVRVKTTARVRR